MGVRPVVLAIGALAVAMYGVPPAGAQVPATSPALVPAAQAEQDSSAAPPLDLGMVTITMDDGAQVQYDNAFPILSARGIPATTYIVADRMPLPWYVTVDELDEMVAAGWEVGSHSVTHSQLAELSLEEIDYELRVSKGILEDAGYTVENLAYPYGSFDERVIEVAKQYYETAADVSYLGLPYTSSEELSGDEPWQLARYHIQNGDEVQVKSYIDQAIAEKGWVIFFFHMVFSPEIRSVVNAARPA